MTMSEENQELSNLKIITSGSGLFLLSLVSMGIYTALTLIILHLFHEASITSLFRHGLGVPLQLLTGTLFGLMAAISVSWMMFRTVIAGILKDYTIVRLLSDIHLSRFDRIQISLFAGVGEELLFRGALQPLIGIWLTSLLFVGLHGYFKFKSLKHIAFGLSMFALSVGLGLLYEWAGLLAAITAHAVYDLVMLQIGQRFGFGTIKTAQHT